MGGFFVDEGADGGCGGAFGELGGGFVIVVVGKGAEGGGGGIFVKFGGSTESGSGHSIQGKRKGYYIWVWVTIDEMRVRLTWVFDDGGSDVQSCRKFREMLDRLAVCLSLNGIEWD